MNVYSQQASGADGDVGRSDRADSGSAPGSSSAATGAPPAAGAAGNVVQPFSGRCVKRIVHDAFLPENEPNEAKRHKELVKT